MNEFIQVKKTSSHILHSNELFKSFPLHNPFKKLFRAESAQHPSRHFYFALFFPLSIDGIQYEGDLPRD